MRQTRFLFALFFALLLLPSYALAQEGEEGEETTPVEVVAGPTLRSVQARGQLMCGVNDSVFGFGFLNPNTGEISGLYVDFCRALAAATVGEAEAVDFRLQALGAAPTGDSESFDVMFNHGVWLTLSRDADLEAVFSRVPVFNDGASVLSRRADELVTWEELDGETVCTLADSQSAADFATRMDAQDLNYESLTAGSIAEAREAFFNSRCSALVLERSLLEIMRQSSASPGEFSIWSDLFSRQPIAPLYEYGDPQWSSIVDWTLWGLIQAENLDITSENIDDRLRNSGESDEAYIERVGLATAQLIDPTLGLGGRLGLAADYMAQVIRQVGNYGEIYDRHLGPTSALQIERSLNALWEDGGLIYAPDWR